MNLRMVTAADLPAIQALIQASFVPTLHPYMISTQVGAEAFLRVFVDYSQLYPERHLILSETDSGGLLGYAEFRLVSATIGFLSYICVTPSARGQGIATQIIQYYLAEVPEVRFLQLDVFTNNKPAISLYYKLGFTPGNQKIWWLRDLRPSSKSSNLVFDQLPQSLASLEKYGFCELTGTASGNPFRFGIMGVKVLRCFDVQHFLDLTLIAYIAAVFPDLCEVLAILPADDHFYDPLAREINRSVCMTLALPHTQKELI